MRRLPPTYPADLLAAQGLPTETFLARSSTDALAAARGALPDESYDRLIIAGGDGTINSILPVFAEAARAGTRRLPLAILPVGSVNVLARELHIPRALPAAIQIAAHGSPRPIDLGLLNGQPFVTMAGLGFDAAAVHEVGAGIKRQIGVFSYVYNGLRLLLTYPARQFHITCDEQRLEMKSWQMVITNASSYTYRWSFAPQARIDDNQLEVCLLPERGPLGRLKQTAAILLNRPDWAPVICLPGRQIELQIEPEVAVQLDGDPFPAVSQAKIEVLRHGLEIIAPLKEQPA